MLNKPQTKQYLYDGWCQLSNPVCDALWSMQHNCPIPLAGVTWQIF